jgi:hypothetical protein
VIYDVGLVKGKTTISKQSSVKTFPLWSELMIGGGGEKPINLY